MWDEGWWRFGRFTEDISDCLSWSLLGHDWWTCECCCRYVEKICCRRGVLVGGWLVSSGEGGLDDHVMVVVLFFAWYLRRSRRWDSFVWSHDLSKVRSCIFSPLPVTWLWSSVPVWTIRVFPWDVLWNAMLGFAHISSLLTIPDCFHFLRLQHTQVLSRKHA